MAIKGGSKGIIINMLSNFKLRTFYLGTKDQRVGWVGDAYVPEGWISTIPKESLVLLTISSGAVDR